MVGRGMNEAVYKYLQARRKGIAMKTDRKKRLSFAKKMKMEYSNNVWKKDIDFFETQNPIQMRSFKF